MTIAHLSDLHIYNNKANMSRLFWTFVLASGIPSVLWPLVKPVLLNARKQFEIVRWLLKRPGAVVSPMALALAFGVSLPLAFFMVQQFVRFKRIFYVRQDSPELRDRLVEDVHHVGARHVAFTGDMVNVADETEFEIGARLVSDLGGRGKVTVVAGNHDIDIQKMRRPANVSVEEKLAPYLDHMYVPKTFPRAIGMTKRAPFPFVRFVKPEICLIGLDTTTFNPITNARGSLDPDQLELLGEILGRPAVRDRFKIILLHHHICDMPRGRTFNARPVDRIAGKMDAFLMEKLTNAEALHPLLDGGEVDLVLYGHKHVPYSTTVGKTRVLCAGSATHTDPSGTYPPSYNLIRIEAGAIEVSRRVFRGNRWEDGEMPEALAA